MSFLDAIRLIRRISRLRLPVGAQSTLAPEPPEAIAPAPGRGSGRSASATRCARPSGAGRFVLWPQADPAAWRARRWANRWGAAIAVAALVGFFVYLAARIDRSAAIPWRGDFGVHYRAGQDMAARRPLYYLDYGVEETFKGPPVEALALTAIAALPPRAARLAWYLTDLALLGVIFALAYRTLYPDGRWTAPRGWLALATFAITSSYIMNQMTAGQTTTLWVVLSMLACRLHSRSQGARAGAALAAAVCVKLVPCCFLPYLVGRGRRVRTALAFAGVVAALVLLPAAWVGWDANCRLLADWLHNLSGTLAPKMFSQLRNQSLHAVLFRFLSPTRHGIELARLDLNAVYHIATIVSCLAGAALYGWMVWAYRADKPERRDATILALLLIFMNACNPLGWRQNCVALVFPYFLALDAIVRYPRRRGLLVALFVPAALLVQLRGELEPYPALLALQVVGGRFWANLLLAGSALVAHDAANQPAAIRLADLPERDERADVARQPAFERRSAA